MKILRIVRSLHPITRVFCRSSVGLAGFLLLRVVLHDGSGKNSWRSLEDIGVAGTDRVGS